MFSRTLSLGIALALGIVACAVDTEEPEVESAVSLGSGTSAVAAAVGDDEVSTGTHRFTPPPLVKSGLTVYSANDPGDKGVTPATIFSVRAPSLGAPANQRLSIRAEVPFSRCAPSDYKGGAAAGAGHAKSPCEKYGSGAGALRPYGSSASSDGYDPYVAVRVILAKTAGATTGVAVTGWSTTHCTQEFHHCQVVLAEDLTAAKVAAAVAAAGGGEYLNLQIASYHPNAGPHDLVELDAECANFGACTDQADHPIFHGGQLTVERMGSARTDADTFSVMKSTSTPLLERLPIELDTRGFSASAVSVASVKLTGIKRGDVIDVPSASVTTRDEKQPDYYFHHYVISRIVLANSADAVGGSGVYAFFTPTFGNNCHAAGADNNHPAKCPLEKAGAVTVSFDPPGGEVYVNYVVAGIDDNGDGCLGSADCHTLSPTNTPFTLIKSVSMDVRARCIADVAGRCK